MAAQVQGRTLERQADGFRRLLCGLTNGEGTLGQVQQAAQAMRCQLLLAERLAKELAQV